MEAKFYHLLGHSGRRTALRPKIVVQARPTLPTGRSAAQSGPPGVRGQLEYPMRERGSAFELMKRLDYGVPKQLEMVDFRPSFDFLEPSTVPIGYSMGLSGSPWMRV